MKRMATTLLLTAPLLLPGSLLAHPHPDAGLLAEGEEELDPKLAGKIEAINLEFQKAEIRLKAGIETARLELQELMKKDVPPRKAVVKKVNQIADLEAKLRVADIERTLAFIELLGPEKGRMAANRFGSRGCAGMMGGMDKKMKMMKMKMMLHDGEGPQEFEMPPRKCW